MPSTLGSHPSLTGGSRENERGGAGGALYSAIFVGSLHVETLPGRYRGRPVAGGRVKQMALGGQP